MPLKDILGRHLYKARNHNNLSQEYVADRAGISSRYYQSLEKGSHLPSLYNYFKLIDALDSDPLRMTKSIWQEWKQENTDE